ncbi:MAG: hypothetical protein WCH77_12410 [Planctomycetota bacterium]
MPRFALLEHTGAPDDPGGRHFDLLLEAGEACRTWRLLEIPQADGPPVAAIELPPHRLVWLERIEGEVSGGRGVARRVAAGSYEVLSSDDVNLMAATELVVAIAGNAFAGRLRLEAVRNGWSAGLA